MFFVGRVLQGAILLDKAQMGKTFTAIVLSCLSVQYYFALMPMNYV